MIKRILSWLLGLPIIIVLLLLALANRHMVTVSLDLVTPEQPWLGFEVPMWVVLYAGIFLGLLAGGVATWMRQSKWRRKARRMEKELAMERVARKQLERELLSGAAESEKAAKATTAAAAGKAPALTGPAANTSTPALPAKTGT